MQDGKPGAEPGKEAGKFVSFDAVRGLLALIVCIGHSGNINAVSGGAPLLQLGLSSRLAVLAFFALSGFVIAGSLRKNAARNGGRFDLREYAASRFLRVMPPLLGVLALLFVLQNVLHYTGLTTPAARHGRADFHPDFFKIAVSLCTLGAVGDLTGNLDGPLWSLRYEIRCYVTAGVLAWLYSGRAGARRLPAVLFLCAYWFVALFIRNKGLFSNEAPSLFCFAAGMLAYRLYAPRPISRRALAAGILCFACGVAALGGKVHEMDESAALLAAQCLCGVGIAAGIAGMARVNVSLPLLRGLGGMSYTLYILHYPLMLTLFFAIRGLRPELFAYPKLLSFAGILVSLAASALFAHWLERDYSGFCRRMARGWKCWHRSEKTA